MVFLHIRHSPYTYLHIVLFCLLLLGLADLSNNFPVFSTLVNVMGATGATDLARTCTLFAYSSELSFRSISLRQWGEDPDVGIINLDNELESMFLLQKPNEQAELSLVNCQWRKFYQLKATLANGTLASFLFFSSLITTSITGIYYKIKTQCECWLCKASSNSFLWPIKLVTNIQSMPVVPSSFPHCNNISENF
jgi:hypothetical protein